MALPASGIIAIMALSMILLSILVLTYPVAAVPAALAVIVLHFVQTTNVPACSSTTTSNADALLPVQASAPPAKAEASAPPAKAEASAPPADAEASTPPADVPCPTVPLPPVPEENAMSHQSRVPVPANTVAEHPLADEAIEQPQAPPLHRNDFRGHQRAAMAEQRALRRRTEWSATARWTQEDKDRYEMHRRQLEYKLAMRARPDPHTIIQPTSYHEDGAAVPHQPFAPQTSDAHVWHTGRFRAQAAGTGDMASLLRTAI